MRARTRDAEREVLDVRFFRFAAKDGRAMVLTSVLTVGYTPNEPQQVEDMCATAERSLGTTDGEWEFLEQRLMERTVPLRDFVGFKGPVAERVRQLMRARGAQHG